MKITYEIYKNVPYIVYADMNDTARLTLSFTRGDVVVAKLAGEEKKLYRGNAVFDTSKLKDGIYRVQLYTKSGAHELIPIKISFGTAKLYHADNLIAEIYRASLEQRCEIDELRGMLEKITVAVFGNKIL